MLRWLLLSMLLFPFAECSYVLDDIFPVPVLRNDPTIYKDDYGSLMLNDSGMKRLRPCMYNPIQCIVKRLKLRRR
ncbi:Protein DML1 [Dirofilaria immitis]